MKKYEFTGEATVEGDAYVADKAIVQDRATVKGTSRVINKAVGIETAGSINILFSDKTGTITKGELKVVDVFGGYKYWAEA